MDEERLETTLEGFPLSLNGGSETVDDDSTVDD
jgi:hypothetical protein